MRKARSVILSGMILIVAISYGNAQAARLFVFSPALTITVAAGTAIHAAMGSCTSSTRRRMCATS
jgi:hypothetical protein